MRIEQFRGPSLSRISTLTGMLTRQLGLKKCSVSESHESCSSGETTHKMLTRL